MARLRQEDGIALFSALMFTLLALAVIMVVLYLATRQNQVSASQKRYRTALAAAYGGVDVVTNSLMNQLFTPYSAEQLAADFAIVGLTISSRTCLDEKLTKATATWNASKVGENNRAGDPVRLDDPKASPDFTFRLRGLPGDSGFTVYSKLTDTVPGNTNTSGFQLLESGDGTTGEGSPLAPRHIPYLYRIEVEGERTAKPRERARLSVLYAY